VKGPQLVHVHEVGDKEPEPGRLLLTVGVTPGGLVYVTVHHRLLCSAPQQAKDDILAAIRDSLQSTESSEVC
jgi:hypothetical protein